MPVGVGRPLDEILRPGAERKPLNLLRFTRWRRRQGHFLRLRYEEKS